MTTAPQPFSEREFYLAEFRGRTIGIAWPPDEELRSSPLLEVVDELVSNGVRVVALSPQAEVFDHANVRAAVDFSDDHFAPQLWRVLRDRGRAGLLLSTETFEQECQRAALALGLAKVVWIQAAPPLERKSGAGRVSVVDLAHLESLLGDWSGELRSGHGEDPGEGDSASELRVLPGRGVMLHAIRDMLDGGIPSVNVCAPQQLAEELFTYAGAGMFFTRDRYAEVRPLGIDDYDPASDLIARGEADGYLVPRNAEARDAVLVHALGVFIEGRYLAGIGAVLPHPGENAGEIASLFALTRYVGEGVGAQIVRYAMERARQDGLTYLFSCTTSDRVEAFFLRQGFRRVSPDDVPKAKWEDYDRERQARVRCIRFDP
ncbi:MAG: GNAT family N-acetyltransferase [Myxococcales bacterium]|nr:GNAT family N-acetyltransferase [Myxococcales bacterium]HIK84405.1 GNAT family N-acetyltransferase [Myxococcales bacterium]